MAFLLRWQRQLCLWLLLLLGVAFPASMVVASGECYRTAMRVPRWCRSEFIKALVGNDQGVLGYSCCIRLWCVFDLACFPELEKFCAPPDWAHDCRVLKSSNPSKPVPPPVH
ncbi:unnamed protein product [Alopecurus aequalis]